MRGAPEAHRSCDDCARWLYKEDGERLTRGHQREPVPNLTGKTPCATCPKVPPDAPARTRAWAVELSERNLLAWQHYQQCKAVGQFPNDPLVKMHAAVIAGVLKSFEDQRLDRLLSLFGANVYARSHVP